MALDSRVRGNDEPLAKGADSGRNNDRRPCERGDPGPRSDARCNGNHRTGEITPGPWIPAYAGTTDHLRKELIPAVKQ
jgi:hypothetical protein